VSSWSLEDLTCGLFTGLIYGRDGTIPQSYIGTYFPLPIYDSYEKGEIALHCRVLCKLIQSRDRINFFQDRLPMR
jgi:hypothetical protein